MLVSSADKQTIPLTAGQRRAGCGRLGYYFATSPAAPFQMETLAALDSLYRRMAAPDETPGGDHASLPPVFACFAEFISHDILGIAQDERDCGLPALDDPGLRPEPRASLPGRLLNARTGRFDLDSLYGRGWPTGNAALDKLAGVMRCPGDRAKMWIGEFGGGGRRVAYPEDSRGDLPRLDQLLESGRFTEADIDALPAKHRALFRRSDGTLNRARAVIGDARNDRNLFLAQLHLAFLRFHNQVVLEWPEARRSGDEDTVFAWARRLVRRFYQWQVLNVWLPAVCDPLVVCDILASGPLLYDDFLIDCDWAPGARLPVPLEFAAGCFRFGQSMLRGSYDWNENFGRGPEPLQSRAGRAEMALFTGYAARPMDGLGARLPASCGAAWDRLVHPHPAFPDRAARRIGPRLAHPSCGAPCARDLRRGVQYNLAAAQDIIVRLNGLGAAVPALTGAEIASGATAAEVARGGFDTHTPLWFYTLKEAEILGHGQRLGPLGSHIVAGTVIGLILRGPDPVWEAAGSDGGRWHPVDGPRVSGQLVDDFAALMRAALLMDGAGLPGRVRGRRASWPAFH